MNRLVHWLGVVSIALAVSPMVSAEEPHQFAAVESQSRHVPATANRDYRLLSPVMPSGVAQATYPLVVYLHGSGAKGDDNAKPIAEPFVKALTAADMQRRWPCFVLVPQCRAGDDATGRPNNWVKWDNQRGSPPSEWVRSDAEVSDQLRGAMAILDDVLKAQPVDHTRVYLVGVSMGGSGAWNWAAREPHRFAAIVPICGLSEVRNAAAVRNVPAWTFHGTDDATVPIVRTREMAAAAKQAGGTIRLTEFAGAGHNIVPRVVAEPGLFQWLFAQRREQLP